MKLRMGDKVRKVFSIVLIAIVTAGLFYSGDYLDKIVTTVLHFFAVVTVLGVAVLFSDKARGSFRESCMGQGNLHYAYSVANQVAISVLLSLHDWDKMAVARLFVLVVLCINKDDEKKEG